MTAWKNENIDLCRVPVLAFITLETEYAKNFIDNTQVPFFGDYLEVKRAPEATDVIWENQHYDDSQRFWRFALAAAIMVIVLITVLYALNSLYKIKLVQMYVTSPPYLDCSSIRETNDISTLAQASYFQVKAVQNYNKDQLQTVQNTNTLIVQLGRTICFC